MKIEGISFSDELKMIKGVDGATPKPKGPGNVEEGGKQSFLEFLGEKFEDVNRRGVEAENAISAQLRGDAINPHSTILAVQKASIALTLMMGIKMRLERAYQELIRMQLG